MKNKLPRIFVADDDEDIIEILGIMLRSEGYDVYATTNAEEIFNPLFHLPDLILLDLWMMGIDGKEICRKVKANERTRHIPLLFLSANSNLEQVCKDSEADGFIAKPFEMDYLLKKVADFIPVQDEL